MKGVTNGFRNGNLIHSTIVREGLTRLCTLDYLSFMSRVDYAGVKVCAKQLFRTDHK